VELVERPSMIKLSTENVIPVLVEDLQITSSLVYSTTISTTHAHCAFLFMESR